MTLHNYTEIVQELIESLLDNVISNEECDIAGKGRRLSEGLVTNNNKETSSLDVMCLIREDTNWNEDTLIDLTLHGGHTNIVQLKCVEQKVSGYCGHYALFNILCMLEMHNAETEKEMIHYIKQTSSIGSFWRRQADRTCGCMEDTTNSLSDNEIIIVLVFIRYWWSIDQLLVRANEENSWPWTETYITKGDMERSFLNHLLSTDSHVHQLQGKERITVLQFAYGLVQNSFNDVCEIQNKIDTFRSTPGPNHISFILGITNHWMGITVCKTGQLCPCCCVSHTSFKGHGHQGDHHDKIDMIVLDSNNNINVTASNEEIVKRVEKSERERIVKTGKGFDNWRRNMFIQSHIDQRDITITIAQCVSGMLDLRQVKAEGYIRQILTSYTKNVDTPLQSESPDYYLPLLLSWMDNYYPPQMLRDGLIPLVANSAIVTSLSSTTYQELVVWAEINCLRLEGMSLNGLPSVQMFDNIINQINNKLQQHL